jgi:hypothetical protein
MVLSAALEWFTILLFEPALANGERDMIDDYDGTRSFPRMISIGWRQDIEYTSGSKDRVESHSEMTKWFKKPTANFFH